jgi:xanthine dehydrogenase YagT iron-sulfur-binding subunit
VYTIDRVVRFFRLISIKETADVRSTKAARTRPVVYCDPEHVEACAADSETSLAIFRWSVTRREFVLGAGIISAGVALGVSPFSEATTARGGGVAIEPGGIRAASTVAVTMTINGQRHELALDPRVTLLDLLRNDLDLTGTKKGCDHGQCGACTVLANGRRINSCLSLAATHYRDEITTIEGLASGGELHAMQTAFVEHDGLQCGYCTPGQICSAVALIDEAHAGDASFVTADLAATASIPLTPMEIRERMSGNICRCGAYPGIVAAIASVEGRSSRENRGSGA